MRYVNSKVVEINNKLYASIERVSLAGDLSNAIIIVRHVEKKIFEYPHPIKGSIRTARYEKAARSPKSFIQEDKWDSLPDQNTDQTGIDMSY